MSLILSIETGTNICSVALSRNDELLALCESDRGQNHARELAVFIDEILREGNYTPDELDAVAVSKGPGSYTGLRIGISTAKGLCYALQIPLIAIGSLESLANVCVEDFKAGMFPMIELTNARLCPMIDARRMEVYAQVFDGSLAPLSEVGAHIIDGDSFSEYRDGAEPFLIFGDGAKKTVDTLGQQVQYLDVEASARGLIAPAWRAFQAKEFEDVAYFEPFYLKDFVVTRSKKIFFK